MKYKVRIKKSPDQMAYGGQLGYGLDLGAKRVYADMTDNPYDSVSDTLQPVDRSVADIEAELGETIIGDFDQDGQNEHMKVGGKRHSQGGTPLKVPDGSFVYSDTKRMRIGGPVLSMFGKSASAKKKYTPAQLAKQYDINSYKAILEDPHTDELAKSTAANMIANYEKKLGGLALLQESMKGFPQGIPQIAMPYLQTMMPADEQGQPEMEYGGYYFQPGGEKKPKVVDKKEIAKYEKEGYKQVPGTRVWRKTGESKEYKPQDVIPGKAGTNSPGTTGTIGKGYEIGRGSGYSKNMGPCANLKYTVEDIAARPGCYNTFLNKQGFKDASDEEKKRGLDEMKRGRMPKYTPGTPGSTTPGTPETKQCPPGYTFDPNAPDPNNPCVKIDKNLDELTYEENTGNDGGGGDGGGNKGRMPFFGKQFAIGPKRYTPYVAPLNAMIPNPTFYDPNRELAEAASQRKMMTEYMAGMDPQAFGARASALNAQGAEQAANTIGRYQNMNVGVANQFSPLQTDIMNRIMAYRADATDKLVHNAQQEDKAYRNAQRTFWRNWDAFEMGKYDYNTKKNMLNATNPYYTLEDGPGGGNIQWRPDVDWRSMVTGQSRTGAQPGADQQFRQAEEYALQLKNQGHDAGSINLLTRAKFPTVFGNTSSSSRSNLAAMNRNYMGLNMPGMNNSYSAYPFSQYGFDIDGME